MFRIASYILLLMISQHIYAFELNNNQTGDDYYSDIQHITSVSRVATTTKNSPLPVTIVTREMIESLGAITIADILRILPEFQVSYRNDNRQVVSVFGLSTEDQPHILLLLDGVPMHAEVFSSIDWSDLPININDIEKIEIISRTNSTVYGRNSLRATVNIITTNPEFDTSTNVQILTGSNRTKYLYFRKSQQFENYSHNISLSRTDSDGFDNIYDSSEKTRLNYRGNYRFNIYDSLQLAAGISSNDNQMHYAQASYWFPERTVDVEKSYLHTKWVRNKSINDQVKASLNYQKTTKHDLYDTGRTIDELFGAGTAALYGIPDQVLSAGYFHFNSEILELEYQHNLKAHDRFNLAYGFGLSRSKYQSKIWADGSNEYYSNKNSAFVNSEWQPLNNLSIHAGLMHEDNTESSPATSWMITPVLRLSNNQSLRFTSAESFRLPTLFEHEANAVLHAKDGTPLFKLYGVEPDLKNEKSILREIGYNYSDSKSGTNISLAYFEASISMIREYSDLSQPAPLNTFSERGLSATIEGHTLSLKKRMDQNTSLQVRYAEMNNTAKFLIQSPPPEYLITDKGTPEKSYSILLNHNSSEFNFSIAYYYTDTMDWLGRGDSIAEYDRLDLHISRDFIFSHKKVKTELIVQNIGEPYSEFLKENVFNTRTYLRLTYTF